MSEHLTNHQHFDAILGSHERAWSLKAAEHEDAAEKARDTKKTEMAKHIGAPESARRQMEDVHDKEIARHESQGRIHRRRAAMAGAGYLLEGPDETRDGDYMKAHQGLHTMAHGTGRCRHVDDSVA